MSDISYHSPNDLAKRWAVTPQHVRQMIRQGRLSAIKVGSCVRVPETEVRRIEQTTVA